MDQPAPPDAGPMMDAKAMNGFRIFIPLLGVLAAAGCGRDAQSTSEAPVDRLTTAMTAPGVSLPLARHRAATLRDVRYDLALDVTDSARAPGTVTVAFQRSGVGDLVLDYRGISMDSGTANGQRFAPEWKDGHVIVPAALLAPGENTVSLPFVSAIAPAGASIIRYDDATDGSRYLYTLLVPSDAQMLFPAFDQPDLKAGLTFALTVPDDWQVLANGPEAGRTAAGGGTMRWTFAETKPISTYLMAFAAGPWTVLAGDAAAAAAPVTSARDSTQTTGSDAGMRGDVAGAMRLFVRKSRANEVDADTLLALTRGGLARLERYFDLPYPFAKLDILLAPAFPFGGMEHVGAIFFNESSFIFREPPTLTRRLGRMNTINHELAHQWFGDLVTMKWFDDLWLKEGFATYMAAKTQAELFPESGAWKTFYLRNKPLAYAVDATSGTTPVWQDLENLDLAKSNYGPIVYNKAPAVLEQLEFLVGDTAFRDGVRAFLKQHAYTNATWQELLSAVGGAGGTDLRQFGEQYMLRAGMPVIETHMTVGGGRIGGIALEQRPARTMPNDPGGWWPAKVVVRLGYHDHEDVLIPVTFPAARTQIPAAVGLPVPDFVWPNDGDHGYGLFLPDSASAEWMLANAGKLKDDLLRAMAWGALWDLVREARLPPGAFAERALTALPAEKDEQIAATLLGRAGVAIERYLPPGPEADRLAGALETLLLRRSTDASLDYGMRKASLDALLDAARTPNGIAGVRDYLAGRRRFDGKPIAQPSRWSAVTHLLALGVPGADSLFAAEQKRDTTPEAGRQTFIAQAAIPTAENKRAVFDRYFEDASLNEEWVTSSLGAFNDPRHAELTLPFLRPALDKSEWIRDNRRIFFLPRWIDAFIGGQSNTEALQTVDTFLRENPSLPPDIKRRVLQARDDLERTVAVRQAATDAESPER